MTTSPAGRCSLHAANWSCLSQASTEESASPLLCNLDEAEDNEMNERRGLPKAASSDSLQFLVPLQQDATDDEADDDDESYSIPLSMRRPRSDSGSRYLTDDVRHVMYSLFLNLIKLWILPCHVTSRHYAVITLRNHSAV